MGLDRVARRERHPQHREHVSSLHRRESQNARPETQPGSETRDPNATRNLFHSIPFHCSSTRQPRSPLTAPLKKKQKKSKSEEHTPRHDTTRDSRTPTAKSPPLGATVDPACPAPPRPAPLHRAVRNQYKGVSSEKDKHALTNNSP